MSSVEKKNWYAPLFIFVTLATVFGVMYYISTDSFKQQNNQLRKEFDYAGRPVQTPVNIDHVILQKDKRLDIDRISLVFKNIEKKSVLIDLYLLDLDPQQPFTKKFLIKDAKKEMSLGGKRYRLLSANDNFITLSKLKKRATQ